MSDDLRSLIDGKAELDEEADDESIDDEVRGPRRRERNADFDDSSEEEEDDEEEARKVREGFIVEDEDEEDAESDAEPITRKKRKRREREVYEELDEDDFDLIGEQVNGTEPEMKRLKQRHGDDGRPGKRGLEEMFSDEDEEGEQRAYGRSYRQDEFDDFIEEDYPEDADELQRHQEDIEVSRSQKKSFGGVIDTNGLDKEALEDIEAIFANSENYDWALELEETMDLPENDEQGIELKDVFEHSQIVDKMLTEEDNEIRFLDEPERFQLDRRPFKGLTFTDEQFKEECRWISNLMLTKKRLDPDLIGPFNKAVGKVMEFFIVDGLEVPYVFHHRKDYLIHTRRPRTRDRDRDGGGDSGDAEKLLTQEDLWHILEQDVKFRSLIEKRNALEKAYDNLKDTLEISDPVVDDLILKAQAMEDIQDLQDYLHFQYSAELKDMAAMTGTSQSKRPGSRSTLFERVRKSSANQFVKAYGITADQLAKNISRTGQKVSPDDPNQYPDDLADSLVDSDFATGDSIMSAACQMFAEEVYMNPRLRKHLRQTFLELAQFSCRRTDKGLRKIDESHPYYDIKYLMNHTLPDIARSPELFLKMMKAEDDGLIEVKLSLQNESNFRRQLYQEFESDNFSDKAERWGEQRRKVLDLALTKLEKIATKYVKETLRNACQDEVIKMCRDEYFRRLDQTPFKPKALDLGETPRVLALTNGMADPVREPIAWVYVDENGKVIETGKLVNLGRDETQRDQLADIVKRLEPDVIGVSGWCASSHNLVRDLENLVSEKGLIGPLPELDGQDDDELRTNPLEVVVVNDEVARLYKDSPRASAEHPNMNPLNRYCIALAHYMQNPLKEYAALGKDIMTLSFHPCQNLLPQEKLQKHLENAMVDMVNLCGVNINQAVNDPYTANLLPYIAGLGPRKASNVIKAINKNGGVVNSRDELVGDMDRNKIPVVGPRVWNNLASFLYIEYDSTNPSSDPLDNTRVHPEDYELGRKMAADALELDEEDVKAETDQNGAGAIVRKLFRQNEQDKVNELVLEEYAEQLERNYNQKKRATLENIRAELQNPYEELRKIFAPLTASEIFTQFTGETSSSLCRDMIVPVNVRVVKEDFVIVKLDSGIEGRVESHEIPHNRSVKEAVHVGQTVQAKVLDVAPKEFSVKLTLREEALRRPFKRHVDYSSSMWDYELERHDRDEMKEKNKATGRTQRVINHPLFKPFNSTQAEEYLGSQPNGEVIIRPSSKGNDHLAVTWKVADGIFQHVDVLELQKENEFSLGRILRVGGKYNYSDLDELIVEHIKAMSKKVDELMQHEKFERKSKSELEKWLTTYVAANPNRSAYAFCLHSKYPGFFWLVFKINQSAPISAWPVKVIPQAYEMLGSQYPDMRALCNGFKLRYQSEMTKIRQRKH